MRTPFLLPTRGDVLGALFVAAVLVALVLGYIFLPTVVWQRGVGSSFGPDWDCQYVPKGEPVCIKRVRRPPAN